MADPVDIYGPPPQPQYDPSVLSDLEASFGLGLAPLAPVASPIDLGVPPVPPADLAGMEQAFAPPPVLPEPFAAPAQPSDAAAVDAVSGGGLAAPTAHEPVAPEALTPDQAYEQEFSRQSDLAQRDPEAYAREVADREAKREASVEPERKAAEAKKAQADLELAQTQQKASAVATQKMQGVIADAEELSHTAIDPDHYMQTMSSKDLVAGLIGGLFDPNRTMAMMRERIAADIDAQKANIDTRRAALGLRTSAVEALYQRNQDAYAAGQAVALATWKAAETQMLSKASQFDPNGTMVATKIMPFVMKARAEQAKIAIETEERLHKREHEDQVYQLDVRKQKETERHQRSSDAQGWAGEKRAGVKQRAELAAMGLDEKGNPIPGWKPPVNTKAEKDAADASKAVADAEKARIEADSLKGTDPRSAPDPSAGGKPLTNSDGSKFHFQSEDEAKAGRKAMADAQKIRTAVDKIKVMIANGGGASEIIKSEDFQKLKSTVTSIDLANAVNFGLGAISKDDLANLVNERGGVDPASFIHDATAGLDTMADNLESGVNTSLTSQGYSGPTWRTAKSEPAKNIERTTQELGEVISNPIPPHAKNDPAKRKEYVDRTVATASYTLDKRNPTAADLTSWAQNIDAQVQAGDLTKAEAQAIVVPMAKKVAASTREKTQAEFRNLSVEELKQRQKDPEFLRELQLVELAEKGGARPEELYRIAIGGGS